MCAEELAMSNGGDRSLWVMGGTTMVGLGVGLIVLKMSALWFVGSLVIGIGAGLVLMPFVPRR
jgi:hypothetical protein